MGWLEVVFSLLETETFAGTVFFATETEVRLRNFCQWTYLTFRSLMWHFILIVCLLAEHDSRQQCVWWPRLWLASLPFLGPLMPSFLL